MQTKIIPLSLMRGDSHYIGITLKHADDNDTDAIEWGTVEHSIIERKCYIKETQQEETETEGEE